MHSSYQVAPGDDLTFKHVWLETADEVTFGPPGVRCGKGRTECMSVNATWPSDMSDSTMAVSCAGAHVPRGLPSGFPLEVAKAGAYPAITAQAGISSSVSPLRQSVCALSLAASVLEIVQALKKVMVCIGVLRQLPAA